MHAGRRFLSLSLVPPLQPGGLQGVMVTGMEQEHRPGALPLPGKPGWHQAPGVRKNLGASTGKQGERQGGQGEKRCHMLIQNKPQGTDGESKEMWYPCTGCLWAPNQKILFYLPLQPLPHLGEHNIGLKMNKKGMKPDRFSSRFHPGVTFKVDCAHSNLKLRGQRPYTLVLLMVEQSWFLKEKYNSGKMRVKNQWINMRTLCPQVTWFPEANRK